MAILITTGGLFQCKNKIYADDSFTIDEKLTAIIPLFASYGLTLAATGNLVNTNAIKSKVSDAYTWVVNNTNIGGFQNGDITFDSVKNGLVYSSHALAITKAIVNRLQSSDSIGSTATTIATVSEAYMTDKSGKILYVNPDTTNLKNPVFRKIVGEVQENYNEILITTNISTYGINVRWSWDMWLGSNALNIYNLKNGEISYHDTWQTQSSVNNSSYVESYLVVGNNNGIYNTSNIYLFSRIITGINVVATITQGVSYSDGGLALNLYDGSWSATYNQPSQEPSNNDVAAIVGADVTAYTTGQKLIELVDNYLKNNTLGNKISLGISEAVSDAIDGALDNITSTVNYGNGILDNILSWLKGSLAGLLGNISDLIDAIKSFLVGTLAGAITLIQTRIQAILDTITGVTTATFEDVGTPTWLLPLINMQNDLSDDISDLFDSIDITGNIFQADQGLIAGLGLIKATWTSLYTCMKGASVGVLIGLPIMLSILLLIIG